MKAVRLLAEYERIADTPDAVPRLRRLILDLAVRGKLVQQHLDDEPASELLKRIAKEWEQLHRGRGTKRSKSSQEQHADRYELPPTWSWVRLGAIAEKLTDGSHNPPSDSGSGYPMLSSQNVLDDCISFSNPTRYLSESDFTTEDARTRIAPGDVLLTIVGSIGRSAVVPHGAPRFALQRSVAVISTKLDPRFLSLQFRSPTVNAFLTEHGKGTAQKGIYLGKLSSLPIAVPPLAEQRRIVANVDELMALCNRLEAARAQREATRDRLTAASLARLNAPDADRTIFARHVRFALDNLPALTTRPDQFKQLRQTVLSLAVRGRLVPQDAKEEPASELLKGIAAAKAERKRMSRDARIKIEPDPTPASLPMTLPAGWAMQSFENLFLFIDYRGKTPPKTTDGIPLITAKNIRMGHLQREPREYVSAKTFETWMTRGIPQIGDVFFTTEAPLANVCLNDIGEPFALAQRIICLQPYGKIDTRFLLYVLMSELMQSLIDAHATGMTAKGIKSAKLKPLPIPIAPLAEQRRIVARVDELMALCDELEASLSLAGETRRKLLEALTAEALAPPSRPDVIARRASG
jgi:type I restriction enzyme S subunit